jgi:hypothetical protein
MFKTFDDVRRVAELGKSDKVLDLFITSYLQGETLRDEYRTTLGEEESYDEEQFQAWLADKRQSEDFTLPEVDVAAFKREHYAMFRRGMLLSYFPQHRQNEAIVEALAGDSTLLDELKLLKDQATERFPKGQ